MQDPRSADAPTDFFVLSGFLGSGKTSLLADFLCGDEARRTAVIVNEVGEIGIDGAIVAETAGDFPVALLSSGCVCCSLRSGLIDTVDAVLDSPRPPGFEPLERIVLETSGLSRPGPIIASLADPELSRRNLRIAVLATYDCQAGSFRETQFEEAAAQLAAAQRIVLTKVDTVRSEDLPSHRIRAQQINPLAEIVAESDRRRCVERAFASLSGTLSETPAELAVLALRTAGAGSVAPLHHGRIRVWTGSVRHPLAWEEFSMWLDDLAGFCGERLLRVKAMIRVADCEEPILVQGVGTTFGAPRRMAAGLPDQDVLVVITRDLELSDLEEICPGAPIRLAALDGLAGVVQAPLFHRQAFAPDPRPARHIG